MALFSKQNKEAFIATERRQPYPRSGAWYL